MATETRKRDEVTWESIFGPRTLLGRFVHPMLEQRKTLAGRLAWLGLVLLIAFIVIAVFAPILAPYDPTVLTSTLNQPPSAAHWMGTDDLGRDVFSRVLWGARSSLEIMVIGVLLALVIGFPVGLFSGYHGGYLDRVLVLVMDSVYAFPGLLLAALVALFLGKGVLNIGIAITVIYIPLYYRVTRNHTLSVKEETYVEAARALGAKPRTVMWSYIASNVLVSIPVIFSLNAADAILTAAGLSFLGFGLERPTPDWGLDLSDAQRFLGNGIWWTSVFPGLMIILLTVGLSFLGEGLNDLVNPLLKKERQ
ncbi:MAG TPA: ABC transporter permease [Thermoplasmata archaeon]|nr:ABC transporter permease [Thermoplasmata archaeon]